MTDEKTHARADDPLNEKTRILDLGPPLGPRGLAPRGAFLAAFERLRLLAETAAAPSLAVVAVNERAQCVGGALVSPASALVLGRHSECSLQLPSEDIALRQIAVLARREGECLMTHVWDLATSQPFGTEAGVPTAALLTEAPAYLAVGDYSIWVAPTALLATLPSRATDAWDALPPRRVVDRRQPTRPRPVSRPVGFEEHTEVTLIPPLVLLGVEDLEIPWGTLHLEGPEGATHHRLSAERLERGILIGRYERCGLSTAGLDRISRVHLLLVRIGDEVWAVDTASTHKSRRNGAPISAVLLEAEDELELARVLTVRWKRDRHAEA